jgi:hypothetical protein
MSEDFGPEAQICASNNVDWYRAVLATHGLNGNVANDVFQCHGRVPPYYSNAVAFLPGDITAQLQTIEALAANLNRQFTVNDCFARLPLETLGFRTLFDAQWIWRAPGMTGDWSVRPPWRRVTCAQDLANWETAWRKFGSPISETVFLPDLLENPVVALFAAHANDKITGVCAANRSEHAVGFSNFFTDPHADSDDLLASAVQQANLFAPGLPVVGYERGESLKTATKAGFRPVGPLRIWLYESG